MSSNSNNNSAWANRVNGYMKLINKPSSSNELSN